jgi:hypothetical protein
VVYRIEFKPAALPDLCGRGYSWWVTRRHIERPPQCPHCGSGKVVPIAYGLPTSGAGEESKRGEIVLGGCCVSGDDPEWFCRDCGWAWNANRGEQWARA